MGSPFNNWTTTGSHNNKGLFFYGAKNSTVVLKTFGAEEWWGGQFQMTIGALGYNSKIYLKLTPGRTDGSLIKNFMPYTNEADMYSYYLNTGLSNTSMSSGDRANISGLYFAKDFFIPLRAGGSDTTYECDRFGYCYANASYFFGGASYREYASGVFSVQGYGAGSDGNGQGVTFISYR